MPDQPLWQRRIAARTVEETEGPYHIPATGPDRELVLACRRYAGIEVTRRGHMAIAAHDIAAERDIERELLLIEPDRQVALDLLCALRATTVHGHAVRARLLDYVEPGFARGELEWSAVGGRILAALLRDLLAMEACAGPETTKAAPG